MKTQQITLAAIFISLSVMGGMVKIPLGIASIALDAMPALVAALFLPAPLAGFIAGAGHLLSALSGGMPLGPLHILIAAEMFAVVWLFARLHRDGKVWLKWGAFIIGNGILAAMPFYFLLSPAFFYASVPGLLLAAFVNAAIAALVTPFVSEAARRFA